MLLSSYGEERHALAIDTVRNIQRATTLVTLQNPISQLVRNQLARVLMNTDLLRNRMGPNVGMLHVGYRNSSVVAEQLPERTLGQRIVQYLGEQTSFSAGPAAGERVPMSPRMLDVVSGGRHTLLIFCGSGIQGIPPHLCKLAEQVATRYLAPIHPVLVSTTEDPVNGLEVLPDPGGELHRRHGATTECLYLIRPDHHIAYRSHNVDLEGLFAYLDRLFVPRSW